MKLTETTDWAVSSHQLNSIFLNHRFELARRWRDCFYEDFGDESGITSEELICGIMEVIESMIAFASSGYTSKGVLSSKGGISLELITRLHRTGLSHSSDLISSLGGITAEDHVTDREEKDFITLCSIVCDIRQAESRSSVE